MFIGIVGSGNKYFNRTAQDPVMRFIIQQFYTNNYKASTLLQAKGFRFVTCDSPQDLSRRLGEGRGGEGRGREGRLGERRGEEM